MSLYELVLHICLHSFCARDKHLVTGRVIVYYDIILLTFLTK